MLAELVQEHDAEASKLGPTHKQRVQANFRRLGRVPSVACASCHAREFEAWKSSKHSHAMETLAQNSSAADPNCLACHYQDASSGEPDDVAGVGCGACHSNTADHALAKGMGRSGERVRTEARLQLCVRCHDSANSPRFNHDSYWESIAHGRATNKEVPK